MSEVLIIILIYLIAKLSLDILQIQTIKTVPIDQQSIDLLGINSNEEYKSRRYNIEKLKISIIRNVIFVGWIIYLLSGGLVIEINSYLESFLLNEYTAIIKTAFCLEAALCDGVNLVGLNSFPLERPAKADIATGT